MIGEFRILRYFHMDFFFCSFPDDVTLKSPNKRSESDSLAIFHVLLDHIQQHRQILHLLFRTIRNLRSIHLPQRQKFRHLSHLPLNFSQIYKLKQVFLRYIKLLVGTKIPEVILCLLQLYLFVLR